MNTLSLRTIPVSWDDLLNSYQGAPAVDPLAAPYLDTDSGEITCRMLMDDTEAREKMDNGRILLLPTKDGVTGFEQRVRFVDSLCDEALAERLKNALGSPTPFHTYDEVLSDVPVESARWREVEYSTDIRILCGWLRRAGLEPDPPPRLTRKIIEFPKSAVRNVPE